MINNTSTKYHQESLSNKSFLITGGAGFIGSNLVGYLLENEAGFVRVLDNFSTGKLSNLKEYNKFNNLEIIEGDIRNYNTCKMALDKIDYVSHQAALGSVPRSIKDPLLTNEVNINGFINILDASRKANVKRFVYAASSSTYGDSVDLPKIEEKIGKPLSPYAITKLVNELYAEIFSKNYGIETIGLRYFNVFGKKQDPDSTYAAVIPLFIKQLISCQSPLINGDGENSRDFTYIDNVIQMNVLSFFVKDKKAINCVYNTACGERTTINQLFNTLKNRLSKYDTSIMNINPIFGPSRIGDIPHSLASIKKAQMLLNYDPKISINLGLEKTVEWYLSAQKNNK